MSKSVSAKSDNNLPEDFFDFDKKSKKIQDDELDKQFEEFIRETEAIDADSTKKLNEELDRLQKEKEIDELEQQVDQWNRIIELERRTDELKNRPIMDSPSKKFKANQVINESSDLNEADLDEIEDIEDNLLDWRSKGL